MRYRNKSEPANRIIAVYTESLCSGRYPGLPQEVLLRIIYACSFKTARRLGFVNRRFLKLFTEQKLPDTCSPDGLLLSVGGHQGNRLQGKKLQGTML